MAADDSNVLAFDPWNLEGRKRGRPKKTHVAHPQLGDLYAGAADSKGHRTTISVPQDLADRMASWQAKLKGSPFDSPQGMVRHALHILMDMLDEVDDVQVHPELRRWLELDKARAQAEQEQRFVRDMGSLVEVVKGSMQMAFEQRDAVMLAKQIGKAEVALEGLSPSSREMLETAIEGYERELSKMMKDTGKSAGGRT